MAFKDLTPNNWDQPDESNKHFVRLSPVAGVVQMDGTDWARSFLSVQLDSTVPDEICDLFAVARGLLLYGWFFYPLFMVGEEQLHRVAEAAAVRRYHDLEGPNERPRFAEATTWLTRRGEIDAADEPLWRAIRELRNIGAHPRLQMVMPPGQVRGALETVARAINLLFA